MAQQDGISTKNAKRAAAAEGKNTNTAPIHKGERETQKNTVRTNS